MGPWLSRALVVSLLFVCGWAGGAAQQIGVVSPEAVTSPARGDAALGPTIGEVRTNLGAYANQQVPRYDKFELAFDITDTTATNPYFFYDENTPPGVAPATGITVDARLLAPGETNWSRARVLPCFYYQPVEQVGNGDQVALLPVGRAEWRCRFTPDAVGIWRYKIQAADGGGSSESPEGQVACVSSRKKGFVTVSQTDSRFFELADGTPFVTPLINVEQGSPFNAVAGIRDSIQKMGEGSIRFVRWFPTGEGANYFVAPYGDNIRINWGFGDGRITPDDADTEDGKLFSYAPYYYSLQQIPLQAGERYRLSFRARIWGDRVLRSQIGHIAGATIDICSTASNFHESQGELCAYKQDGWHSYSLEAVAPGSGVAMQQIALRGLYAFRDAPAPYNNQQDGNILVHSIQFQRDETGEGDWGPNLLTRPDPDAHLYVDQPAAAKLDEILELSEDYGVYHKLTLFHKQDALLSRLQSDGTIGPAQVDNFYSAEGQASRWYQKAYVRYFIGRWSYSTALHSLELANENNLDQRSRDAAFAIAEYAQHLSPRPILMSNSFWGWWVDSFWNDPDYGHLVDYADKHWYANQTGRSCDGTGTHCELISNVWTDSAAYVRECGRRFDEYAQDYAYDKPIVRGEGGVAQTGTGPQHPLIATDAQGTYYHKKLWAHVGTLGYSCDGEWYPRLFVPYEHDRFPNDRRDLYQMFAAYGRFVEGEPLSNGAYVEIGTDLHGGEQIAVRQRVGLLRAWGVRDSRSHRVLLWIDNAQHTWVNVVDGGRIQPASGTLVVSGLRPDQLYRAVWWDPYASDPAGAIVGSESIVAQPNGSIEVAVQDLARDVALKIFETHSFSHVSYLPLALLEE